jgi:hypothetical protein
MVKVRHISLRNSCEKLLVNTARMREKLLENRLPCLHDLSHLRSKVVSQQGKGVMIFACAPEELPEPGK